ncbi:MAG: hypothetical protein MJE77_05985 [Proteobacteria bacterium]|nr:hypothetical protein [Pseudomonadota bacterium]
MKAAIDRCNLAVITAVACAGAMSCFHSSSTLCEDGLRCPEGLACVPGYQYCATPDEIAACSRLSEDERCKYDKVSNGVCRSGTCVDVQALCGNGVLDEVEVCDPLVPAETFCAVQGFDFGGSPQCSRTCTELIFDQCGSLAAGYNGTLLRFDGKT